MFIRSNPKLDALINNCSLETAQSCFRSLCPGTFKRQVEELENPDPERFAGFNQFGELPLDGDNLLFAYAETEKDLTERSARKAQFDAARDLLKARAGMDGGIFIFRGPNGAFRQSYITKVYKGTKADFSHYRRYSYFVDPAAAGHHTFRKQIGGCAFDSQEAIQEAYSVETINKDFYTELANWYFWAMKHVHFPTDDLELDKGSTIADAQKVREHDAKNLIRLLTRMLFVWFIKQRGLVPHELFDAEAIARDYLEGFSADYLDGFASQSSESRYYKAILQNFFFAALNQERGKREFRKMGATHRDNMCLMRYKDAFKDPQRFLDTIEGTTPFLNGGLFECLDFLHPTERGPNGGPRKCYEDGFSDHKDNPLIVPDFLFFAPEHKTDLSDTWGIPSKSNEPVQGLIHILNRYNFTIVENSPIEQEVALDPELLGKVFENLLASYNPETQTTARKQTGSFYTPRPIVDYMVDESLKAYLLKPLTEEAGMAEDDAKMGLDLLFSYEEKEMDTVFNEAEVNVLIGAIDSCKILDPACGSGAFPMGILQKLVFVLGKLDPDNERWEQRQVDEARKITDAKERRERIAEIMQDFKENDDDYGRKLFLIENCLYGVDIQSIATQVSKLRFFISLVVDQKIDREKDNFGVRPLPNLETKFVAADTLIAIDKPGGQKELSELTDVKKLQDELQIIRHKIFSVKTTATKQKYKADDKAKREEIAAALKANGWPDETADRLARWDPYKQNDSADFFDPDWMFGLSGFDVVIGNPPYLKERDNKEVFDRTTKTDFGKKHHVGKMDYWYFFLHRAFEIAISRGVISFITSRYWMNSSGAKHLIETIQEEANLFHVVDIGSIPVFEAVAGYHMVHFYRTSSTQGDCVVKSISNSVADISSSTSTAHLSITTQSSDKLFRWGEIQLCSSSVNLETGFSLEDHFQASQGVVQNPDKVNSKTAALYNLRQNDGVFVLSPKELNAIKITASEKAFVKDFYEDASIKRFYIDNSDVKKLLYVTKDNCSDPQSIPNLIAHLRPYKAIMEARRETKKGSIEWFQMHWPRKPIFFEGEKVVIPSMFDKPKAAYIENSAYFGIAANVIIARSNKIPLRALSAILNSNLASWWFHQNGKKRGIGVDIGVSKLRNLPMPMTEGNDFSVLVNLEKTISFQASTVKTSNGAAIGQTLEALIDACVMECYFRDHMAERDLLFQDAVATQLKDFDPEADDSTQAQYLETLHTRLQATDLPQKLQAIPEKSPDLLGVILKEGKV